MSELKPCPFCGGDAELLDYRLQWMIACKKCDASINGKRAPEPEKEMTDEYWETFRQSAIKAWNTRTN